MTFVSYGKNLSGRCPVWYTSKDLERIENIFPGTTVYQADGANDMGTFYPNYDTGTDIMVQGG